MTMLSRSLIGFLMVFALAIPLNAAITMVQIGSILFVIGDDTDDSVRVSSDLTGRVRVFDHVTGDQALFFDITGILVATGDGDDDVMVDTRNGFNDGFDIVIGTGAGNDSLELDTTSSGNNVTAFTGGGQDNVLINMFSSHSFGGSTSLSTGPGADVIDITAFDENVDINMGWGNDTISGIALSSIGTVDGQAGTDTCSGFDGGGTVQVVNCEN